MSLSKYKFLNRFSANGTDGTDATKMSAFYKCQDSEGWQYDSVAIPKNIHDSGVVENIEAALTAELAKLA